MPATKKTKTGGKIGRIPFPKDFTRSDVEKLLDDEKTWTYARYENVDLRTGAVLTGKCAPEGHRYTRMGAIFMYALQAIGEWAGRDDSPYWGILPALGHFSRDMLKRDHCYNNPPIVNLSTLVEWVEKWLQKVRLEALDCDLDLLKSRMLGGDRESPPGQTQRALLTLTDAAEIYRVQELSWNSHRIDMMTVQQARNTLV
jgi:hypothetical protein